MAARRLLCLLSLVALASACNLPVEPTLQADDPNAAALADAQAAQNGDEPVAGAAGGIKLPVQAPNLSVKLSPSDAITLTDPTLTIDAGTGAGAKGGVLFSLMSTGVAEKGQLSASSGNHTVWTLPYASSPKDYLGKPTAVGWLRISGVGVGAPVKHYLVYLDGTVYRVHAVTSQELARFTGKNLREWLAGMNPFGSTTASSSPTANPAPSASPTATPANAPAGLYPLALHETTVQFTPVGAQANIFNGNGPGNYTLLAFDGNTSFASLSAALQGNSGTFTDPVNGSHTLAVGSWVTGASPIGSLLYMVPIGRSLPVAVWDKAEASGSTSRFHISGFANVTVLSADASSTSIIVRYEGMAN